MERAQVIAFINQHCIRNTKDSFYLGITIKTYQLKHNIQIIIYFLIGLNQKA